MKRKGKLCGFTDREYATAAKFTRKKYGISADVAACLVRRPDQSKILDKF